ncbi:fibroleukin-like, partial [Poecilia reticulata]|uniref:fibroleukin-like n=1 Tax=Poecilia reticulata TaxID=8081 RepID=UPI0004A22E95
QPTRKQQVVSGWRPDELPKEPQTGEGPERTHGKLPTSAASAVIRDCSDHLLRGKTRSGLYLVTPDLRSSSFQVYCDMELDGGGWTLLQRRQDGSVSFNRPWVDYQAGFGVLDGGEFWLGNNKMHLLTRDRDMELRVELEDFDGVTEHAQYEHFRVASERLRYRLTVGGYSGTAGDALRFSKTYDHNNRAFTTPDRDNDRYPSGNCGAYYSSGWWFDACMAANLNGKYYFGKYKGVRDGIFWGTWHNISTEYYPTNERQSFKSVRMMTRPKSFGLR